MLIPFRAQGRAGEIHEEDQGRARSLTTDGPVLSPRIGLPVDGAEEYAHSCKDGLQNILFYM